MFGVHEFLSYKVSVRSRLCLWLLNMNEIWELMVMRLFVAGCADGWYGPGCNSSCDCLHHSTCHHVTGKCTCSAGWEGVTCNKCKQTVKLLPYVRINASVYIQLIKVSLLCGTDVCVIKWWRVKLGNNFTRVLSKFWTKRKWNCSLISRVNHLITYWYHGSQITPIIVGFWHVFQIDHRSRTPLTENVRA